MRLKTSPEEAQKRIGELLELGNALMKIVEMDGVCTRSTCDLKEWHEQTLRTLTEVFSDYLYAHRFANAGKRNMVLFIEEFLPRAGCNLITLLRTHRRMAILEDYYKQLDRLKKDKTPASPVKSLQRASEIFVCVYDGQGIFKKESPDQRLELRTGFPKDVLRALLQSPEGKVVARTIPGFTSERYRKSIIQNWSNKFNAEKVVIEKMIPFQQGYLLKTDYLEFQGL